VRPLWMAVGVLTCVIFGSTLNKCLTCAAPAVQVQAAPVVQGALLDAAIDDEAPLPATREEAGEARPKLEPLLPPKPEEPTKLTADGKYLDLTFDKLASYTYEFPDPESTEDRSNPIPENIMQLSGKDVAIRGFMVPVTVDGEEVVEFLLVRNQFACCFGVIPKMNEWLHITMKAGHKAPYAVDIPITVSRSRSSASWTAANWSKKTS